jgi:hypothetical protein
MRRAVGPIAWVVLEHVAGNAEGYAGETVSYETVRRVADALDLAKDTVARSLRRLADAGLLVYVPTRSGDGRFASSYYRLTFPPDLFLDLPAAIRVTEVAPPVRSTRQRRPSSTTQLSLIEPFSDSS